MSVAHSLKNFKAALLGLPMLVKVAGIAVGMIAVLAATLAWQIDHSYYQLEKQELREQAGFVAEVIALGAEPMLQSGDRGAMQRLLDTMGKVTPATGTSIERLEVRTGDGGLTVHTSAASPGSTEQVFEKTVPIAGTGSGQVSATLSDGHIGFELGWHKRRILWTTAIIAFVGMAAGWCLMRLVTRPVLELVRMTRCVKAGDYEARAPAHTQDEIGELAVAFNDMMGALQQKELINRRLTRKLISSEEEMRKCLAHELQDQTGQALASLVAGLAAIESGADLRGLPEMRSLASKTLRELYDLTLTLRPTALEELGLVSALQKFCHDVSERFGVKVGCAAVGLDQTGRLASEIEVALYRIGQEALTNAVRHGQARTVDLLVQRKESSILAVIEDDGKGFDASDWRQSCLRDDCLGLFGIEERAVLLGGSLRVESRLGRGTSLFVEIPLREAV
ncbi:MAG TPA: HAMP domain-containing protein [Verrucomicrobiae bacterium]